MGGQIGVMAAQPGNDRIAQGRLDPGPVDDRDRASAMDREARTAVGIVANAGVVGVRDRRKTSRSSLALSNLRGLVIVVVLAFHSVLAYLASVGTASPGTPSLGNAVVPFNDPPYAWRAFPIVDSHHWLGFDIFCAWQDVYLMSLMFFLSALFTWSSLKRKGSREIPGRSVASTGHPDRCRGDDRDADRTVSGLSRHSDRSGPAGVRAALSGPAVLAERADVVPLGVARAHHPSPSACTALRRNRSWC